jgi:twitching motility protein PilT
MIEEKDRTKEIPDAIAQGHQSYGMQTFDQSLMFHLRNGLITYDEALRQATNPDDFALRVSGISATSDSKWDDFESKGAGRPSAPPAPAPRPAAASTPPAPARVATPAPNPRPAASGTPSEPATPGFEIERF